MKKIHQRKVPTLLVITAITASIFQTPAAHRQPSIISLRHPHRKRQTTSHARTKITTPLLPSSTPLLVTAARSPTKHKKITRREDDDYPPNLVPHTDATSNTPSEPTLDDIRASLGPIGRTIAGGVEVGVITAGSYISGGIMGYLLGGAFGVPLLFRSSGGSGARQFGGRDLTNRLGAFHEKAVGQAATWANLSAAFSGFHALSRVVRGGREDKWNGILGSAATGAYLSRKGGPRAMAQGCATYAGITYLLDSVFGGSSVDGKNGVDRKRNAMMDDEYEIGDDELVH